MSACTQLNQQSVASLYVEAKKVYNSAQKSNVVFDTGFILVSELKIQSSRHILKFAWHVRKAGKAVTSCLTKTHMSSNFTYASKSFLARMKIPTTALYDHGKLKNCRTNRRHSFRTDFQEHRKAVRPTKKKATAIVQICLVVGLFTVDGSINSNKLRLSKCFVCDCSNCNATKIFHIRGIVAQLRYFIKPNLWIRIRLRACVGLLLKYDKLDCITKQRVD